MHTRVPTGPSSFGPLSAAWLVQLCWSALWCWCWWVLVLVLVLLGAEWGVVIISVEFYSCKYYKLCLPWYILYAYFNH